MKKKMVKLMEIDQKKSEILELLRLLILLTISDLRKNIETI